MICLLVLSLVVVNVIVLILIKEISKLERKVEELYDYVSILQDEYEND